jgi:transposase
MDDNARPHKAQIVQHFLQQEAVQTIPWPAMSPDMNPIEHVYGTLLAEKLTNAIQNVKILTN